MKIDRSTGPAIDRRVARTRALLQDALIALIAEKGYAALTVEDICAKANVGRSTFYAHYTGKDDLRSATINAHLRSIRHRQTATAASPEPRFFEFSLPMLEHAHAFRALHQVLLSSAGDSIHDEIRNRIGDAVRHELGSRKLADELAIEFVAGAFLSVLAWWIGTDPGLSPAEIDDRFQRLARSGVESEACEPPAK
jgi:AcrR family transcriptional regulator